MNEKQYLRDLALRQAELAASPENQRLREEWYKHNSLQGDRPMVVFEEETCKQEFFTPKCEDPMARYLESQLLQNIRAHELIGDDKVVPDFIRIPVKIESQFFGVTPHRIKAAQGPGFHDEPVLVDLSEDLEKLSASQFTYNREETRRLEDLAGDVMGDILPPRRVNELNQWHFALTQHVVNLMGMENMFLAMYETPEEFHQLMAFLLEDMRRLLRWEEKEGLLFPNAGNDYMGSGSYCFNHELPDHGPVTSRQTWGHTNSQETVCVSPQMYGEFIFPYLRDLAGEFGLLYYGCCEPANPIWDDYISKLPNLRKVSVSAWCDEAFMAERLAGSRVIYSRKPTPNFLGVGENFDEAAFRDYMAKTINLTRDCHVEIIFRDIYTLHGDTAKARRAVEIVRSLI